MHNIHPRSSSPYFPRQAVGSDARTASRVSQTAMLSLCQSKSLPASR